MEITNSEADLALVETLPSAYPIAIEASPDFFKQRREVQDARMRENIEFIVANDVKVPLMMY